MAARVFLRIFALIGVVLSACNGLEMSVESNNVPLGGTIIITCTTKLDFNTVATLLKEYPEDTEKPYVNIADNHVLVNPFSHIERYVMSYIDKSEGIYTFILTISGALVEDSGNFICRTSESDKKMVTVNVVVPPESIDMMLGTVDGSMHIVNDGEELKFDGGEQRRVICNVNGGNPDPKLHITAGDLDIIKQFNITYTMVREPTKVKGLVILRSSITAVAKSLPMKGIYSGKKISCTAEAAVEGVAPISVGFRAKFSGYKPVIKCYNTLISYVHQTNVNITCQVTARPRPDNMHFYYYLQNTKTISMVQPGHVQGHYRGEVQDDDDKETFQMVLYIDRIFPQMFRNYFFVAESSFGKTEHKVYLERDRSRETSEGDANRIGGVVALVMLALAAPRMSYL